MTGIAAELGLDTEIPAILDQFAGTRVEYGEVERAYALNHLKDWAFLAERYGHRATAARQYTVSSFLAATLGNLHRAGAVEVRSGPATGRWTYNGTISWWSLPPAPAWERRLSWEDSGAMIEYVPGQTEARMAGHHKGLLAGA